MLTPLGILKPFCNLHAEPVAEKTTTVPPRIEAAFNAF
jgi:hypothetical protein